MSKGDELLGIIGQNLYKKMLDNHIKELFDEINSTKDDSVYKLDVHLLYQLVIKRLSKYEPICIKRLADVTDTCDIELETLKLLRPLKKLSKQHSSSIYVQIYDRILKDVKNIIKKEHEKIIDLKNDRKSSEEKKIVLKRIDALIESGMILLIDDKDNIEILEELLRIRHNSMPSNYYNGIRRSRKEKTYNERILNCMILSNRIAHAFRDSSMEYKARDYFAYKNEFIQNIIDRKEELKKEGIRIYKRQDDINALIVVMPGFPLISVHCPTISVKNVDDFPLASKFFVSPYSFNEDPEYLKRLHQKRVIIPFDFQRYRDWKSDRFWQTSEKIVKDNYKNSEVPDYIMFNTLLVTGKYSIDQILLMISRMKTGNNSNENVDFSVIKTEELLDQKIQSKYVAIKKMDESSSCFESLIGIDLVTLLTNQKNKEIVEKILQNANIDSQVKKEILDILEYWKGKWNPDKNIKEFNKKVKTFIKKHKKKVATSDSTQSRQPGVNAEQIGKMAKDGQDQFTRASSFAKKMCIENGKSVNVN